MKTSPSHYKNKIKRGGAEAACWAHNPKVGGSKPSPVKAMTNHHCTKYKNKNHIFIQQSKLFTI